MKTEQKNNRSKFDKLYYGLAWFFIVLSSLAVASTYPIGNPLIHELSEIVKHNPDVSIAAGNISGLAGFFYGLISDKKHPIE